MGKHLADRWGHWVSWLILTVLYASIPLPHLNDYAWNYDEGPQLQVAALANSGYELYSEVVLNKPPLFTWWLQLAFKLGGTMLATARLATLFITLVGFWTLGVLAEKWWGRWAGLLTMVLFLALPDVPVRAAVVMNDLPAMSTALVVLCAATQFRRTQKQRWVVISATGYAALLMMHPILFFMIVPVGLILMYPQGKSPLFSRSQLRVSLLFGIVTVGLTLLWIVAVDWDGFFKWVCEYNTASVAPKFGVDYYFFYAWDCIRDYLYPRWPLLGLALIGLIGLCRSRSHRFWVGITLIWFLVTLAMLLIRRPMWRHYLLLLVYPVVIAAGGGIALTIHSHIRQNSKPAWQLGLSVLILAGILLLAGNRVRQPMRWRDWSEGQRAARAFLEQEAAPGEFVISDDQLLVFAAGHPVPPSMADTSFKRIRAGYIHAGNVIDAILNHNVRFLVSASGRFAELSNLCPWIEATAGHPICFDETCIYSIPNPQLTSDMLNNQIHLRGYWLEPDVPVQAGSTLTTTLFWESQALIQEDLSVFVHLVDVSGNMWAQHDGPPFLGRFPTHTWTTDFVLPDPHPISIPSDLPAGRYQILVGMYRWPSLERLPAVDGRGNRWRNDSIVLTELEITQP